MLESEAIVVSIENGVTFVQAQAGGSCGGESCATQGCSTAILTQLFSQKPKTTQAANPILAQAGERVVVGLAEGVFLKTALTVYLLPLCALFAGASLGLFSAGQSELRDLYASLGGLLGLLISALAIKLFAAKISPRGTQPTILRRL